MLPGYETDPSQIDVDFVRTEEFGIPWVHLPGTHGGIGDCHVYDSLFGTYNLVGPFAPWLGDWHKPNMPAGMGNDPVIDEPPQVAIDRGWQYPIKAHKG